MVIIPKFQEKVFWTKTSFTSPKHVTDTTPSKYIMDLKEKDIVHSINWEIAKQCSPYRCGTKKGDLCISEKYHILMGDPSCINKNSKLVQKCSHNNQNSPKCETTTTTLKLK